MGRKTFNVDQVRARVNDVLRLSVCKPEIREGWINAIEMILHDSHNYKGWSYLGLANVPNNELPGIRDTDAPNEKFTNTDSTRRVYF